MVSNKKIVVWPQPSYKNILHASASMLPYLWMYYHEVIELQIKAAERRAAKEAQASKQIEACADSAAA